MADWSKPTVQTAYENWPSQVKERDIDAITLLEGRSPTNLPDKAKKINVSTGRLETWNSTDSVFNALLLAHNEALSFSGNAEGHHVSSADRQKLADTVSEITGLTSGEVNQVQNINSVTISNTQWGWLGGLGSKPLASGQNLSDVNNAASAINNLGALDASENLSDVGSASTSRSNLGLGSAATQADTRYNHRSNNLSDVQSASSARSNISAAGLTLLADDSCTATANSTTTRTIYGSSAYVTPAVIIGAEAGGSHNICFGAKDSNYDLNIYYKYRYDGLSMAEHQISIVIVNNTGSDTNVDYKAWRIFS